ncbi:pancreatic alpha-amylase-like isoform X2 [Heteronotia binoei]|uniref:pancreatic alpha-amylase-like isoform X2 n=1 Tax=Heteronotia binoei TaxID=13085 RepID=UPI0029319EA5|nr:pancreatic alpha-amylase-like isoform X2 [Heteronotia binoei]
MSSHAKGNLRCLLLLLLLAVLGLCWISYKSDPQTRRTSIVHLFEWRWTDVALECERYLAPNGFAGIQISPPNENLVITMPWRPWWERYQPISYKICSRSGNENEFRNMVTRCNNVGVHIYVDAVFNHMCSSGAGSGYRGTCGSYFNAGSRYFPAVPYSNFDFNDQICKTPSGDIANYSDPVQVIDMGGEAVRSYEYFGNGQVTEFQYGAQLGTVLRKWNGKKMANLKNWGESWNLMPSDKAIVFVDNHDNQRGHGAGGSSILTFRNHRLYRMAVSFMLAHPYGTTRIMSSYRWPRHIQNGTDINSWVGPPSYSDGSIKHVPINPNGTCGNGWVCEHRWHQIRNMVIFRNVVYGQPLVQWWDNYNNQVAFGRDGKGFIIFNNDDRNLFEMLPTGLPAGIYCDVITGQKEGNHCTGIEIHVAANGLANFYINSQAENPYIAIHVEAKL